MKIRITKIFRFEMAHALWKYEGKCKNIHGHSYVLYVTLEGQPLNEKAHPEDGMIMDFGKLKKLIKNQVIDEFDHAFVINENSPQLEGANVLPFENVKSVSFQPTSENLICHFAKKIMHVLPSGIQLYSLKLSETDTSYVEWYKD
jgi:6-pyruvoyltetrahydropterin/6-carboxytetrahydropterin synthase